MEPYHLIGPLLAAGTFVTLGVMALIGVRIWTRRISGRQVEEIANLVREQLRADIQDEIALAVEGPRAEVEELHERIDFAERLLAQERQPERPHLSTPQ